jgi:UDP-N-acetylglucosamine 2-epimerase (non-hydrolysing)
MMKMAPLLREMSKYPADLEPALIHTGQHYDYAMSQVFFEQLRMPEPTYNLEVGSGTHHAQTGEVMKRFGEVVQKDRPDLIVVVGDVNSTMACALVGVKEHVPVAHVEAGLRSFDRTMPEEINRIVTDAICDVLFITEETARLNLHREGIPDAKIHFTGNVMIDSLVDGLAAARRSALRGRLGLEAQGYGILTLHRPSNVDDPEQLRRTMAAIACLSRDLPVVFPVHPRTAKKIAESGFSDLHAIDNGQKVTSAGIWALPPTNYIDFLGLVDSARVVITDSGGIQEETTYLGVPCLTYRENTERPATVTSGTNRLVGTDPDRLLEEARKVVESGTVTGAAAHSVPAMWDGRASERVVAVIRKVMVA